MSENAADTTEAGTSSADNAVLEDAYNMIVELATSHFIRGIESLETNPADEVSRRELSSQIMQAEMFVDVALQSENHEFIETFKEAVNASSLSDTVKQRLIVSLAPKNKQPDAARHMTRA